MFTTLVSSVLLALAALHVGAVPTPNQNQKQASGDGVVVVQQQQPQVVSFNNYNGISQTANFDNFFGQNNFGGFQNQQTVIVQQEQLVCNTQAIEIVQQRLVVLAEVMKQVILQQVCQVEVQTIVLQQANAVLGSFGNDILRQSSRSPAFDQNVAGLLGQIVGENGQISNNNLGFLGSDVGNSSVVVQGDNWNNATSPESVGKAKGLAEEASKNQEAQNAEGQNAEEKKNAEEEKKAAEEAKNNAEGNAEANAEGNANNGTESEAKAEKRMFFF